MANKIKCTCGHSWSTADSSAKDKYVCHICGKDNTMKDGGWLNKYADDGGEYLGTTNRGFDYNGAWGGTMEDGGDIPQAQKGLWQTNKRAYVDSSLNANKDIEWVKRFYESNPKAVMVPGETSPSTHLIGDNDQGYVFPRIVNMNGQLVDLGDGAEDYARKTNTGIQFPKEQGTWFARSTGDDSGYKMGTGVLKGKPVMQKYKSIDKKAMGGSMPGAVGFTYARTGSIPSNGPYAKKTMASAQNGKEMKFYQEGLDWKPRNISRDGSVIPQAQVGTMVTPLDFTKPLGTLEGVSEVMSAPARTATYLLTGKYQDPSQALGIKNPVGAFAIDAVLDPVNLMGVGMAKNISKIKKAKDLVDLYRIQEKGAKTFAQLAKEGKIPKVFNNPETIARKTAEEKYFGQWFTNNKADLDWYSRDREFTNPEIINLRVPKSKLSQYQNYDKSLSRAPEREFVIPHEEQKIYRKKKEGGVIKDDRGQWVHPGEITEIGSNQITMEGVPYPVLGVSDTGDTKMMYPGEDYKFKGKKVTEYPVSKKWLDKYK